MYRVTRKWWVFFTRLCWVASAGVGREGQQAKRIWAGERGELRTPLQASQQVWTVLQLVPVWAQPTWRKAKPRRSEHSDQSPLLQGCACSVFRSWASADNLRLSPPGLWGGDSGHRWLGEEVRRVGKCYRWKGGRLQAVVCAATREVMRRVNLCDTFIGALWTNCKL